jgi:hypothetical protein
VVSGGIAGKVQQQQGNASQASIAGRHSVPISFIVDNYFNLLLNYKCWCLLMRKRKRKNGYIIKKNKINKEYGNREPKLIYRFSRRKHIVLNLRVKNHKLTSFM